MTNRNSQRSTKSLSGRHRRSVIRHSRPEDIAAIRAWLKEEDAQGVQGNFLCNWSIIAHAHRDRELLVYIDGESGLPVAFQLGRLLQSGILQVRNNYRGKGIGRKMVEHCVKLARKADQCLLYIQCKPSTSIPFWQCMGFTLISEDHGNNFAYRSLEKFLDLPADGTVANVAIHFYPEAKLRQATTQPYTSHFPKAKQCLDGSVMLGQRVLFHARAYPSARDVVVEVEVNGQRLYLDKAKYNEAQVLGVRRCKNGWFIDTITPKGISDD